MLEGTNNDTRNMPEQLKEIVAKSFVQFYAHYVEVAEKKAWMSNQPMKDPFGEKRGHFIYDKLLERLRALKAKHEADFAAEEPVESDSDLSAASAAE